MSMDYEHILRELECIVCKEYMCSPVKQCSAGHSMCEVCYTKVAACPTCRGTKGTCRNYALESILSKIQLPCKYSTSGCRVLEVSTVIKQHEEYCEHGEQACPLKESTKCTWVGKIHDLLIHAKENHDQHPPVLNNQEIRIKNFLSKIGAGKYFLLVEAHNNVFKYGINLDYRQNIIQWTVLLVGPRENASSYFYTINFIDKKNGKEKYKITSTCQPMVKDDQAFSNSTSSVAYFSKLEMFCNDDNTLCFYFNIEPIGICNASSTLKEAA